MQERPRVDFAHAERVRSEGLSRELAGHILDACADAASPSIRSSRCATGSSAASAAWVPAVLRYNAVPAKVLLEVCNLANGTDRRLIQTRAFREEVARAVVEGLLAYYGVGTDQLDRQVASQSSRLSRGALRSTRRLLDGGLGISFV